MYVDENPADQKPKPTAVRLGPGRYRAEISGIRAGELVRVWPSEGECTTITEALAEARLAAQKRANT